MDHRICIGNQNKLRAKLREVEAERDRLRRDIYRYVASLRAWNSVDKDELADALEALACTEEAE